MSCDVTFDENTQYFQPYFQWGNTCIEDKDNSFLIENFIFPKLSPVNTPPSIESSTSASTESSFVPSPIHSPIVSSPRIFGEQTLSAIHLLQVYSWRRWSIIQSPQVHESEPIPDINEEQNMAAIEVQDLPIAVRKVLEHILESQGTHCHT